MHVLVAQSALCCRGRLIKKQPSVLSVKNVLLAKHSSLSTTDHCNIQPGVQANYPTLKENDLTSFESVLRRLRNLEIGDNKDLQLKLMF